MNVEFISVSLLITIISFAGGAYTFIRKRDNEIKNNTRQDVETNVEIKTTLNMVLTGINNITVDNRRRDDEMKEFQREMREDMKVFQNQLQDVNVRLTKLETKYEIKEDI